jgi:pSer/pThr/pTyr-binding forkhead associated (FHA) protein
MSNIEATRVMGAVSPSPDRTMVVPGGGMPTQMGGDPMRTQMGGTTSCPVCKSVTPLMEPYCGDCGFLLTSAPPEETEMPPLEASPAELIDLVDGRRLRLNNGVNSVGRQGTDVLITDATISRNHARITLENGVVTVEDLGSSNGTKVGDLRLSANQPAVAPTGTVLKFGNWQGRLEIGGAAASGDKTVVVSDRTMVGMPPTDDRTLVGTPPIGADAVPAHSVGADAVSAPDAPEVEATGPVVAMLHNEQGPSPDIAITPVAITIGRRAGNTLVFLNDAYISGKHAEITIDATGTYLTDTGSTNGTFVNGQRLVAQERQLLLEGDEVQLGQTRYRFTPVAIVEAAETAADVYAEGAGLETSVAATAPIRSLPQSSTGPNSCAAGGSMNPPCRAACRCSSLRQKPTWGRCAKTTRTSSSSMSRKPPASWRRAAVSMPSPTASAARRRVRSPAKRC